MKPKVKPGEHWRRRATHTDYNTGCYNTGGNPDHVGSSRSFHVDDDLNIIGWEPHPGGEDNCASFIEDWIGTTTGMNMSSCI